MVLLEELYREHRQRLYTVAYAILHQPEEAEDAVHDTFVRLAENRHRLHIRSGEEGRALLTAIARNAAIDRLRHRERANLPMPTFCPDVEDRPSAVAEADALLAAVRALPPLYRDVLLLAGVYGYAPREIATLLGISEATVRQRLSRARKQLKERGFAE